MSGQRLVGTRHPALGIRAAWPVPREVVRDDYLPVDRAAGRARAGAHPAPIPRRQADRLPGRDSRLGPRHRLRGPAEWTLDRSATVLGHVLEPRPDAGSYDRERGRVALG